MKRAKQTAALVWLHTKRFGIHLWGGETVSLERGVPRLRRTLAGGGQSLEATDAGSSEGLLSQALLIPLSLEKRGNPGAQLQIASDMRVVRCASQQPRVQGYNEARAGLIEGVSFLPDILRDAYKSGY